MNLDHYKKLAQKLIDEGNLVLGAVDILEKQMASSPKKFPKGMGVSPKTFIAEIPPADGQFTLAQFALKEGLEKIKARKALNALVEEGKVEILQKGKGRKPTWYKNVGV